MKTVTIQIGNTDNKLTQQEWHAFVEKVKLPIEHGARKDECEIHFFACSPGDAPWQNAAWILGVQDSYMGFLRQLVAGAGKYFDQDSVAWTEGETEFI